MLTLGSNAVTLFDRHAKSGGTRLELSVTETRTSTATRVSAVLSWTTLCHSKAESHAAGSKLLNQIIVPPPLYIPHPQKNKEQVLTMINPYIDIYNKKQKQKTKAKNKQRSRESRSDLRKVCFCILFLLVGFHGPLDLFSFYFLSRRFCFFPRKI